MGDPQNGWFIVENHGKSPSKMDIPISVLFAAGESCKRFPKVSQFSAGDDDLVLGDFVSALDGRSL